MCARGASGWFQGLGSFELDPIGCFAFSQGDVEPGSVAGCDFILLDVGLCAVALFLDGDVVHDGLPDAAWQSDVVCQVHHSLLVHGAIVVCEVPASDDAVSDVCWHGVNPFVCCLYSDGLVAGCQAVCLTN